MLIDILSDTHGDSRVSTPEDLHGVYYHKSEEVDLCLFAGDSGNGRWWYDGTIDWLKSMYTDVVGVPGNHDYWSTNRSGLSQIEPLSEVSTHQVNGLSIATATLWTNFRDDPFAEMHCREQLRDFEKIPTTPDLMKQWHQTSRAFLKYSEADIWLVHFPPFLKSLHEKYVHPRYDSVNKYFVNDMERWFIEEVEHKPKLIVHGHTHTPFDYMVDETRVVCNPIGYVGEVSNAKCITPLTIEI